MKVEEILAKTQKKLNEDEQICEISETPNFYLCFICKKDGVEQVEIIGLMDLIMIDKKTKKVKRAEVSSNMLLLPIPREDIFHKKTIYSIYENEEIDENDE